MSNQSNHAAFTSRYNGIASSLINEVTIKPPKSISQVTFTDTKVRAIWDTGATHSCINKSLASQLNLIPITKRDISGVTGQDTVDVYLIDLVLPNNVHIQDVQVCGVKIHDNVGFLIGMDIISLGDFGVSHLNGNTVFSFRVPSHKEVNYVEEIEKMKERADKSENKKLKKLKRKQSSKSKKANRRKKRRK